MHSNQEINTTHSSQDSTQTITKQDQYNNHHHPLPTLDSTSLEECINKLAQ